MASRWRIIYKDAKATAKLELTVTASIQGNGTSTRPAHRESATNDESVKYITKPQSLSVKQLPALPTTGNIRYVLLPETCGTTTGQVTKSEELTHAWPQSFSRAQLAALPTEGYVRRVLLTETGGTTTGQVNQPEALTQVCSSGYVPHEEVQNQLSNGLQSEKEIYKAKLYKAVKDVAKTHSFSETQLTTEPTKGYIRHVLLTEKGGSTTGQVTNPEALTCACSSGYVPLKEVLNQCSNGLENGKGEERVKPVKEVTKHRSLPEAQLLAVPTEGYIHHALLPETGGSLPGDMTEQKVSTVDSGYVPLCEVVKQSAVQLLK